jgi:hypothetical protein
VQCVDVADRLLGPELPKDPELDLHLEDCVACAHVARGLKRVDDVLGSTLLVAPPLDLQRQLAQIAFDAAKPESAPWWRRMSEINFMEWLARPQLVAAQGLAAVMLAIASWQVFGLLSTFQPVVGDVGYAMALVAGSPAAGFVNSLPFDLQSLAMWSVVGAGGWLVSENGLIGRRLAGRQQHQPQQPLP